MNMRRMLVWWFRVVLSGRLLESFLYLQRAERPQSATLAEWAPPRLKSEVRLADQLPAERGAFVQGIAALPGQICEAAPQ